MKKNTQQSVPKVHRDYMHWIGGDAKPRFADFDVHAYGLDNPAKLDERCSLEARSLDLRRL